ncbi:MAG TPA: CDP-glucose 4,6-dehydratase [Candidatus Marinimicrobia bacterium]|nr:CDP-glucose 4,6-dehydratase [Candidatus Neomarinimicrobiota bacterium]
MEVNKDFWNGRRVLITGHTGFKGSWLTLLLQHLGAEVIGISLDPPTTPSLYEQANISEGMLSLREDIRNGEAIKQLFQQHKPEIVFHLAAQPLVRYSYREPVETYETNVMGTLHVLEGIRSIDTVRAAVMVTTDKCYENKEWIWGYRENDPMGGHDLYSSSKGAAELLIASYRDSYYPANQFDEHKTAIASVRAGNVIGGGDWAEDRLIPDIIRAFQEDEQVEIRNPYATRPWQHVLEPLAGYVQLAEQLTSSGSSYTEAWNFGPREEDVRPVQWIVEQMAEQWGNNASWVIDEGDHPHEANYLKLDCSKAHTKLSWQPKWNLSHALLKIVEWHKSECTDGDCKEVCLAQIDEYMRDE